MIVHCQCLDAWLHFMVLLALSPNKSSSRVYIAVVVRERDPFIAAV